VEGWEEGEGRREGSAPQMKILPIRHWHGISCFLYVHLWTHHC